MASDKARFYMEQAVPQLKEFEEKGIFSKVRLVIQEHSSLVGANHEIMRLGSWLPHF